jgi:hypothetical protein
MKSSNNVKSFAKFNENLNISDVSESKKSLSEDDKKKLYLEVLGKSTEFTKRAGECLRYTKSEIKNTNCNEIFVKLKEKKKEIEDLISDFEVILKDAKRTK